MKTRRIGKTALEVTEYSFGTAPLGDPIEIRLGSTLLTLRKSEAAGVRVTPL